MKNSPEQNRAAHSADKARAIQKVVDAAITDRSEAQFVGTLDDWKAIADQAEEAASPES